MITIMSNDTSNKTPAFKILGQLPEEAGDYAITYLYGDNKLLITDVLVVDNGTITSTNTGNVYTFEEFFEDITTYVILEAT